LKVDRRIFIKVFLLWLNTEILHALPILNNNTALTSEFHMLWLLPDALQAGASQFEASAGKLKRKFWWKNMKVSVVYGVHTVN
jgi:hypothetical protein